MEYSESVLNHAERMVERFGLIPREWLKVVSVHVDKEAVPEFPRWGALWMVTDPDVKQRILAKMRPMGPPKRDVLKLIEWAEENGFDPEDADDPEMRLLSLASEVEVSDEEFSRIYTALAMRWVNSNVAEAALSAHMWQTVPGTNIYTRLFDGHLILGVDEDTYDFFVRYWLPLHRAIYGDCNCDASDRDECCCCPTCGTPQGSMDGPGRDCFDPHGCGLNREMDETIPPETP